MIVVDFAVSFIILLHIFAEIPFRCILSSINAYFKENSGEQ